MRLVARELSVLHGIVGQDARITRIRPQGRRVVFRNAPVLLQWRCQRHLGAVDRIRERPDPMYSPRAAILDGPVQRSHLRPEHGALRTLVASPAVEVENEARVGIGGSQFQAGKQPGRPGRDPEGGAEDAVALAGRNQGTRVRVPQTMVPHLPGRVVDREAKLPYPCLSSGSSSRFLLHSASPLPLPSTLEFVPPKALQKPRSPAGFRVSGLFRLDIVL